YMRGLVLMLFFFSSRRRHTRFSRDWSSDVCSSDLALWELGAEVFTIGVEPDGYNINEKVGSTAPDALRAKVKEVRADIGIALDGDADRVIIVDEHGEVVDGDQLMAVIAQSWHARGTLRANGIVATVMSNLGLERYLT